MRRVVLVLALAAALTGCSETSTGTPTAGRDTSPPTSTSEKKPSTSSKAPVSRPKALDLKGLVPCEVLTEAQRQQLGFRAGSETRPSAVYPETKGCSQNSTDNSLSLLMFAVSSHGIDTFSAAQQGETTQVLVAGYPATLIKSATGLKSTCHLGIDVADGQVVDIMVNGREAARQEQACQKISAVGEAVVATLVAR